MIRLTENVKEPELMKKLAEAVAKLNMMEMTNLEGRKVRFSIQSC